MQIACKNLLAVHIVQVTQITYYSMTSELVCNILPFDPDSKNFHEPKGLFQVSFAPHFIRYCHSSNPQVQCRICRRRQIYHSHSRKKGPKVLLNTLVNNTTAQIQRCSAESLWKLFLVNF